MPALAILLATKIIVTVLLVCIPFLLFSKARLSSALQLDVANTTVPRLYGVALLALVVCYGLGFAKAIQGEFPWQACVVGIVSNAGATLVLGVCGIGRVSRWAASFFGVIALLLTLSVVWPASAMTDVASLL